MIFIVLFLSLTLTSDEVFEVDFVEINQTKSDSVFNNKIEQILLWRWTPSKNNPGYPSGYRIAQWWKLDVEPFVYRKNGGWIIRSKNISIFTKSLKRTKTPFDPEYLDRQFLKEQFRSPYFTQPSYF